MRKSEEIRNILKIERRKRNMRQRHIIPLSVDLQGILLFLACEWLSVSGDVNEITIESAETIVNSLVKVMNVRLG